MPQLRATLVFLFLGFATLSGNFIFAEPCGVYLAPKYQTAKMNWRFRGEHLVPAALLKLNNYKLKYLNEAEIERFEVVHNGQRWIYKLSGRSITVPGEVEYLVVMDAFGRIYMAPDGHYEGIHHSSVPRGGPLAVAGVVTFDSTDNIESFIGATGHYHRAFGKKPGLNWENFSLELRSRGIDVSNIQYSEYDPSTGHKSWMNRILVKIMTR